MFSIPENAGSVKPLPASLTSFAEPAKPKFKLTPASKAEKKPVEWLWNGWVQRGKLNGLSGMPGTGKTTIACDIVAHLSQAVPMPGENDEAAAKRGVLRSWYITNEDDEGDLRWKLENQGAVLDHVVITDEPPNFMGANTLKHFEECIRDEKFDFVTIDSLSSIPFCEDMNSPAAGHAMAKFKGVAARTGATILFLRHRSKKSEGDGNSSVSSGLGSITISGQWRSEMSAIRTKKSGSWIQRVKGNAGPTGMQYTYQIVPSEENDHGRLVWPDECSPEVIALFQNQGKTGSLKDWLNDQVKAGNTDRAELIKAAKAEGRWSQSLVYKVIAKGEK